MGVEVKKGKVYAVISGKGGVGKTVSAINLGLSLNNLGKEVIIVDANLTTPNIGLHLGSPIVPVTLNHVLNEEAKPEEAIYEHESGAKIMPSSLSVSDLESIKYDSLPNVTKKLRKIADYILLDSPAGLGEEAKATLDSSDEIIIVTNPDISAVTNALKTIKLGESMRKPIKGVIITRTEGKRWEMDYETIKEMLESKILGVVPEDDAVKESQRMKAAVIHTHPKSKSAKAYRRIARILSGENPETAQKNEQASEEQKGKKPKKKGFFARLFDSLGL